MNHMKRYHASKEVAAVIREASSDLDPDSDLKDHCYQVEALSTTIKLGTPSTHMITTSEPEAETAAPEQKFSKGPTHLTSTRVVYRLFVKFLFLSFLQGAQGNIHD